MSKYRKKSFNKLILITCVIFLVGILGCDKLPFLENFFPSLSQKKQVKPQVDPGSTPESPKAQPLMGLNTLARVGSWTISVGEFNEKLSDLKELFPDYDIEDIDARGMILQELINQQLLTQDAEAVGVAKEKDIVEAVEEFRQTLLVQEMAKRLTEGIEVTDSDAKKFYDENKDVLAKPIELRVREIVTATQTETNEVLIEILKGTDFATLAKERSISKSAKDGGDLGYVAEPQFPQMESALASLDVGGVSSVFKGPGGYYIMKVEDRRGGEPEAFVDVREEIIEGLTIMKKQEAVLTHIDKLKEKIEIEINEELLTQNLQ